MDKILSARVDESVVRRIGMLADRLHISRKLVIEQAIESYAQQVEAQLQEDVLDRTLGAWVRDEPVEDTIRNARRAIETSMERHRK